MGDLVKCNPSWKCSNPTLSLFRSSSGSFFAESDITVWLLPCACMKLEFDPHMESESCWAFTSNHVSRINLCWRLGASHAVDGWLNNITACKPRDQLYEDTTLRRLSWCAKLPSGGLTLIVWTQKWGFSWKVQRRPAADMLFNESSPPKPPCGHHVHGRHGHGSPVENRLRFSKFRKNTKLWPSL